MKTTLYHLFGLFLGGFMAEAVVLDMMTIYFIRGQEGRVHGQSFIVLAEYLRRRVSLREGLDRML